MKQNIAIRMDVSHRINYIDAMKGIGILLVVLGHCMTRTAYPLNRCLLSFHMPLFFFVSGMLLERRFSYTIKTFCKKMVVSLIVPQITLAVLIALSNILMNVVLLKKTTLPDIDFTEGLWAWFLPTLFFMDMALFFSAKLHLLQQGVRYLLLGVALAVFFLLPKGSGFLLQTVCAFCFGLIGLFFFPVTQNWEKRQNWHGIGFLGIVFCAILSFYNAPVRMFINDYGIRPLFLLTALIGILSMIDLACLLKKSSILQYFGKYSVVVYVTHLSMMPLLHRAYRYFVTGTLENHGKYPHFFILFILVVAIECLLLPFIIRFIPFLFGLKTSDHSASM